MLTLEKDLAGKLLLPATDSCHKRQRVKEISTSQGWRLQEEWRDGFS